MHLQSTLLILTTAFLAGTITALNMFVPFLPPSTLPWQLTLPPNNQSPRDPIGCPSYTWRDRNATLATQECQAICPPIETCGKPYQTVDGYWHVTCPCIAPVSILH